MLAIKYCLYCGGEITETPIVDVGSQNDRLICTNCGAAYEEGHEGCFPQSVGVIRIVRPPKKLPKKSYPGMIMKPVKEKHYGKIVWVNKVTEALRRQECMCLNCGKCKPSSEKNCSTAKLLFKVCQEKNIALAVTGCPDWPPRKKELMMKVGPIIKTHDGKKVWVNPLMESLRTNECLCLNCDKLRNLNHQDRENCFAARMFLELNAKDGLALLVTRCLDWMPKLRM